MKKIYNHLQVMKEKLPQRKYQHNKGYFIVWVFETEGLKQAVMRRLQEDQGFRGTEKFILFKTSTKNVTW